MLEGSCDELEGILNRTSLGILGMTLGTLP